MKLRIALLLAMWAVQPGGAQTFTVLYTFTGGADGANPEGGLLFHGGTLYGTTVNGGSGNGTIFSFDLQAAQKTVLHTFAGKPSDGTQPLTALIRDSAGTLYGTTNAGGADGFGTLFQMDSSNVLTLLHSFASQSDGAAAESVLARDGAGNLYGTTFGGLGATRHGTVFKFDLNGNLKTLHRFLGQPSDGATPAAGLILSGGKLYGTTYYGGASNKGTVFAVDLSSHQTTILYSFSGGADGANPHCTLIADGAGNLYGTTMAGGNSLGYGVVFALNIGTQQETVLHTFGGPEGANPFAGVIRDAQGNFYGTAISGGTSGAGTAYKLTGTGHVKVLHNFTGGADGQTPYAGLVRDGQGNFYGATFYGGIAPNSSGFGNIFVIQP